MKAIISFRSSTRCEHSNDAVSIVVCYSRNTEWGCTPFSGQRSATKCISRLPSRFDHSETRKGIRPGILATAVHPSSEIRRQRRTACCGRLCDHSSRLSATCGMCCECSAQPNRRGHGNHATACPIGTDTADSSPNKDKPRRFCILMVPFTSVTQQLDALE